MDSQTLAYYSNKAEKIALRYESANSDLGIRYYLKYAFPDPCSVLDIGCGSGRDAAWLLDMGYEVFGVEPCDELRGCLFEHHPILHGRVASNSLPNLGQPFDRKFDGILCSAVLMHLPSAELFEAICSIKEVLNPNGRVLLSIPLDRPDLDLLSRDAEGRLFESLIPGELELLFARIGLQKINAWRTEKDALNRAGFHWYTVLFQSSSSDSHRPLDRISAVLRQDKKDATYKYALLRAFAEISLTHFNQANWRTDGRVGIPMDLIAHKWLEFYWPLMDSELFIPQKQGEKQICQKPIAFRKSLEELINTFPSESGGQTAFTLAQRNNKLPKHSETALKAVIQKLKATIKDGPVYYSGRSSIGQQFEYDSSRKEVLMEAALWQEFSLLSSWLIDALILRWAKFTEQIGRDEGLELNQIIALLLKSPLAERDVTFSKSLFGKTQNLRCVWTDKPIKKMAIDHMIPFSLWRNNDLWNLLPTSQKANSSKSDRLPEKELLYKQRDSLISYWTEYRNANEMRFFKEVDSLVGKQFSKQNWEPDLFTSVVNAIEYTALQTGCQRWSP
jgi:SAM-dependent methyltransferase